MHEDRQDRQTRIEWSIIWAILGLTAVGLAASSAARRRSRRPHVSTRRASAAARDQSIAIDAMIDEGAPAGNGS